MRGGCRRLRLGTPTCLLAVPGIRAAQRARLPPRRGNGTLRRGGLAAARA
jgi:hypothetical protein